MEWFHFYQQKHHNFYLWFLVSILLLTPFVYFICIYSYVEQKEVNAIVRKEEDYTAQICLKTSSLTWFHSLKGKIDGEVRPLKLRYLEEDYQIDAGGNRYQCGYFDLPLKEEEKKNYYVLTISLLGKKTTLLHSLWK